MEKTRIIDEQPAQCFPIEWVENNHDNFINGAFVKDWVLAPKYKGSFLFPKWNGTEYYEGATPEEIAEANKPKVQNLKLEQYQELSPTDWYYTRYIETGQEVPLEIKQQRQEIRDKYNNLIQEINNE